jgi:hypothetical protein
MHPDDLRELLRRVPFRPFRVLLTNNTVYEVRHPETAVVARSLLRLNLPVVTHTIVPVGERQVGVALLHIVQFDVPPVAPSPAAN